MKNTTGTTHVLAIGVGKYDHSGFSSLYSPTKDAQLITSSLTGPVESTTLLDLTHTQIRQAIGDFAGHLGEEDTFIALYAGHGTDTPFYALTGTDSDPDKEDTLILMSEFVQTFNNCRARVGLVLLNCCRSGGAFDSVDLNMKGFNTKTNRALVVASRPLEEANEPKQQNHSIFMGAFFHVFGNPNRSSINFSEGIAQVKEEARKRAMLWGVKQQAWSIDQSTSLHIPTLKISAVRLEKAHQSLNFMPNPDPGFVGRENMLTDLTQAYFNPDTTIASVTGVGGAGKSSLATQWYQQLEERGIKPEKIFWWGFYENPSLDEALHRLLKYLLSEDKQIEKDMTPDGKIEVIAQLLRQKEYVVVLDGLEVIQHQRDKAQQQARQEGTKAPDLLGEFLRKLARGPKKGLSIVTSRVDLHELTGLETAHVSYSMGKLSLDDTTELFEKEDIIRNTPKELEDVWKQFDGHALSMRLLTTLLKEYYDCHISALKDMPAITSKAMDEDYSTENRTIDAGKVRRILEWYEHLLQPEEKRFLLIFSMFNTPVSQQDFSQFFQKADERLKNQELSKLRPPQFRKIVNKLIKLRLITQQETEEHPQYITHPLIKEYFSGSHSEQETQSTHQALLEYFREKPDGSEQDNAERDRQIIHHAFAYGDHHSAISAGNRLFPYLKKTLAYAEALALAKRFLQEIHEEDRPPSDEIYADLMLRVGDAFEGFYQYRQAISCFETALQRYEYTYGKHDPKLVLVLSKLGNSYRALREVDKAIEHLERAHNIDAAKISGKLVARNAVILSNLASVYQEAGELEKATQCLRIIRRKDYNKEYTNFAPTLHQLGITYKLKGEYGEAIKYFKQALTTVKETHKQPHPNVANSYYHLGMTYSSIGKFDDAIPNLEEALSMNRQIFTENNPIILMCLDSIGGVYQAMGSPIKALEYCQQIHEKNQQIYKEPHRNTAMNLKNMATMYYSLEKLEEALECLNEALDIFKKIYGESHRYVVKTTQFIAVVSYHMMETPTKDVIQNLKQALALDEQTQKPPDSITADILQLLGEAHYKTRKLRESYDYYIKSSTIFFDLGIESSKSGNPLDSIKYYNRAISILKIGKDKKVIPIILNKLGYVYQSLMGDHENAIKHFEEALTYGEENKEYVIPLDNLGVSYTSTGKLEEANAYFQQSHAVSQKPNTEEYPTIVAILITQGNYYHMSGDIEESVNFYEEALAMNEQLLGSTHPSNIKLLRMLGDAYKEIGMQEKSEEHYKRASDIGL